MKKIICIMMMCVIINNVCFANTIDILNHWAYLDIKRCINNEYAVGYPDNTFRPDDYVKWNEFVKLIVKVVNEDIYDGKSKWWDTYIDYATSIGLIGNDNIDYEQYIKRADVVNILYNYLQLYEAIEKNKLAPSDILYTEGIIKGYEDGTLRLDNNITRAEAVVLINRAIDYKDKFIYSNTIGPKVFEYEDVYKYTNYQDKQTIFLNTYNIVQGKVYYSDLGRFDRYNNIYVDKYNDVVLDILYKLINKENYVLNTYLRESKCVIIGYGTKEKLVDNGSVLLEIILYEDQQKTDYCEYSVKINVYKLWKELNEIKEGIKFNPYYIQKLRLILSSFLNEEQCHKVINGIINNELLIKDENFYLKKEGANYHIFI